METVSGNLASALRIEPGITAIIGSGGKSTLLKTLGLELMRAGGRVLLCTTTHMFPVAGAHELEPQRLQQGRLAATADNRGNARLNLERRGKVSARRFHLFTAV